MNKSNTIMLQGTSSDAGKSLLCTALCRIFLQEGYSVAPFKAQNMSLNSYVTPDGGEIGRAQGIQAEAARIPAEVIMNPILLKPKQDMQAQVILMGKPFADMSAKEYRYSYLPQARSVVQKCLDELRNRFQIVVLEGAGSPAEINLKEQDIVNMAAANMADSPVILVADIDRGGVFASLVGTLELFTPEERQRVAGFIINKFRGDADLLKPGLDFLEKRTGKPVLGVVPYLHGHGIEQEDSVSLEKMRNENRGEGEITVAVIQLPRISNFTDINALSRVPGLNVRYVGPEEKIGSVDAVVIPGTKNTILDLLYLKEQGFDQEIVKLARQGVAVVGICGGYQMLGKMLYDPEGAEAGVGSVPGLGLLDIETCFYSEKSAHQVEAVVLEGSEWWGNLQGTKLTGYEIHTGVTELGERVRPLLNFVSRSGCPVNIPDGAGKGSVFGTHLHGLFDNSDLLLAFANSLREEKLLPPLQLHQLIGRSKEEAYTDLACEVRRVLDMDQIYRIMCLSR